MIPLISVIYLAAGVIGYVVLDQLPTWVHSTTDFTRFWDGPIEAISECAFVPLVVGLIFAAISIYDARDPEKIAARYFRD